MKFLKPLFSSEWMVQIMTTMMNNSNKPKVLICGAVKAYSGYSEHTRTILRSLRLIEDKIDLYVMPYRWAQSSDTWNDDLEELKWFNSLIEKFNPALLGYFDISVQIGTPNEWKNYARSNIGVTAGVETTTIPPEWINQINSVNKVITISEFSKQGIVTTIFEGNKVSVPVHVVQHPVKQYAESTGSEKFKMPTKFNFFHAGQWAPRKNLERMVTWFVEEFKTNPDVGLVLKLQSKSNCIPDKHECRRRLIDLLSKFPERKCKIYLFHGDMTDNEIHELLLNQQAFISATHGEGWGLGIFEAAYSGIPVVAPDFSGYKEFLYADKEDKNGKKKLKPFFQKVNYELKPLEQHHFMPSILLPGMFWAFPMEADFKRGMREVYKDYGRFKKQANELKEWVQNKFSFESIAKKYQDIILDGFDLSKESQIEIIEVD